MSLETAGCGCSLEPELLADPFFIRSLYHLAVYGGGGLGVRLDYFLHGIEVGADVLLGELGGGAEFCTPSALTVPRLTVTAVK
jgi:hypothetical protein